MGGSTPEDWVPKRGAQSCNDCKHNPFNLRGTYEAKCAQRITMKLWKGERNTCPYHALEKGVEIEYTEDGRVAHKS